MRCSSKAFTRRIFWIQMRHQREWRVSDLETLRNCSLLVGFGVIRRSSKVLVSITREREWCIRILHFTITRLFIPLLRGLKHLSNWKTLANLTMVELLLVLLITHLLLTFLHHLEIFWLYRMIKEFFDLGAIFVCVRVFIFEKGVLWSRSNWAYVYFHGFTWLSFRRLRLAKRYL